MTTVAKLRPGLRGKSPGLVFERRWVEAGARHVVGVDEVGRGSWAGPITVGAAEIPLHRRVYKIRDSKQLTEAEREGLFVGGGRTTLIVRGDSTSLSIAAASILAKVTRDRIMRREAESYPHWSFDTNKGYPCPVHKAALQAWGPSAIHRRSWAFMDSLVWNGLTRLEREDPQLRFPV
jgi:ribonuclease HII